MKQTALISIFDQVVSIMNDTIRKIVTFVGWDSRQAATLDVDTVAPALPYFIASR